ncbi:MAG: hypothetical protein Q8N23_01515 [Archangium sp.]|nr:hypothetical protein [Archangium sp.]MDP3151316.1 hypothetical protein [Archangium sp.]MDP3571627.1 hypothetical protein [Archangium sp.]
MRLMPQAPVFPWKPFVLASLGFTLTLGALTGAIDLWNLRVAMRAVPLDHHRAHAFAQLFGFLWLFTLGISLHLAPRFFGAAPPGHARLTFLRWTGIGGVSVLVAGRLGALLPGAAALSIIGAVLVVGAMTAWASLLWGFWRGAPLHDTLHRFLLSGVAWWWLASVVLLAWTLGQSFGGLLRFVPLESVWALALFGGTGSWLWGIFFRAGICTLHVARPSERAQQRLFVAWQVAAGLAALAPWVDTAWFSALQSFAATAAMGLVWWTVRPFSGEGLEREGNLSPRAVQAGLSFLLVFAVLSAWSGLAALDVWAPPLLRDAARHTFTLGGVTLLVLGFAGRMVPGFSGKPLAWRGAYDAGILAVIAAALLRMSELFSNRIGLALAGASGGLALAGMSLVAAALIKSMPSPAPSPSRRREGWALLLPLLLVPDAAQAAACCVSASVAGNGRLVPWEKAAAGLSSSWSHGTGRFDVGGRFRPFATGTLEDELRVEAWAIVRLDERVELSARVPWVTGVRASTDGTNAIGTGIGDVSAALRWDAVPLAEHRWVPGLAVVAQVVGPTGRRPEQATDALGASATGRGTFAVSLGLIAEILELPWFIRLDTVGVFNAPFVRADTQQVQTFGPGLQAGLAAGREFFGDRLVLAVAFRLEHEFPLWLEGRAIAGSASTGLSTGASASFKLTPHWVLTSALSTDALGRVGLSHNRPDRVVFNLGVRHGFF